MIVLVGVTRCFLVLGSKQMQKCTKSKLRCVKTLFPKDKMQLVGSVQVSQF